MLLAALGACLVAAGCSEAERPSKPRPSSPSTFPEVRHRAIPPDPEQIHAADWPVAQIGNETRPVLGTQRAHVLRSNERVTLAEELVVETELTGALAAAPGLRIDHRISLRDPSLPADSLAEQVATRRIRFVPDPLIVRRVAGAAHRVAHTIEIPEEMQGHPAMLSVIARELQKGSVTRYELGPWSVPASGRATLAFGYGIEEPGWDSGMPPVLFRVNAIPEEGDRIPIFERRLDPARDPRDRRWFDAAIALDERGGETLRFAFEAEVLGEAEGVAHDFSFPLIANPHLGPREPVDDRPNILLISLDTLRARSLEVYGNPRATMPALTRRLAERGAVVRAAVTPVPYTPPAHMTMLTGLEPCAHGVMDRHGVLAPDRLTLAEILRGAGYHTAAFTEDAYVVAGAGFARGFDVYTEYRSEENASPGFASETFGAAADWMRKRALEPFFLFVHTYQVHDPYIPPRAYDGFFRGEIEEGQGPEYTEPLRLYEREIRYTDDVLAGLVDAVESSGHGEDTIIVVTSDHGESFGEHRMAGHGFTLYDDELVVPMILRAPSLIAAGLRLEMQVGLVDLVPTLLDLIGVRAPAMIQGRSFAAQLRGEDTPFESPAHVSRLANLDRWSVRTSTHKYIAMRGKADEQYREFLFDLARDRAERKNLVAAPEIASVLDEARQRLARHTAACEAWNETHPAGQSSRSRAERLPGWFLNRDEIEAKLRSLGYVE